MARPPDLVAYCCSPLIISDGELQVDVIFSDGDFQERLPLTGDERHAFLRATTERATFLEPLLTTVRTQTMLKEALWHKARPYRSTGIAKVEAPLLIIPDVHVCHAFNSDQAGALGGSAVVVAAEANDCSRHARLNDMGLSH